MGDQRPTPRRFVVEWRYTPTLRYFSSCDAAAQELENLFTTWRWKPGAIEMLAASTHSRIGITSHRSLYVCDWVEDFHQALGEAESVEATISKQWKPSSYSRLGLRTFFVFDPKADFPDTVEHLRRTLLVENDKIAELVSGTVADLAYVVDSDDGDGWKRHIRVGPMTIEEWLERNKMEPDLFDKDPSSPESIARLTQSLPSSLLSFDLDIYSGELDQRKFPEMLRFAERKAIRAAEALLEVTGAHA